VVHDTGLKKYQKRGTMMKKRSSIFPALALMVLVLVQPVFAADVLDDYLLAFSYQERKEMKINSKEVVALLSEGHVQFIDVRFPEEFAAWKMGFAQNIPLNELPRRLNELDKNKLIVTACPHNDRANIARMYLTTKGYKAKYLQDGLLGLADYLRGDTAKTLMEPGK